MDVVKLFFLIFVSMATTSASIVNTTVGQLQGIEFPNMGVEQFLGIPYAEVPEGGLRFKPPIRKSRMEGVYNASSNSKVCPQPNPEVLASSPLVPGNITVTEDCLRLDIYKPLTAQQVNPLPVMIFIHGGGYFGGASRLYDGTQLAEQNDVIVVAANYRLGLLGFLNTMDENSVGNFGLRDQCSAIEWVYDNIEGFGGNASQITIFGQSAGSSSVLQLALSSLCRGKFQRVIAESGTPYSSWSYNSDPLETARETASRSRCPTESGPLVTCLRQKSFEDIISYQPFSYNGKIEWAPTYSADIFPENPLDIMDTGDKSDVLNRFRSLDILLGVTTEEGELAFVARRASAMFGSITNLTAAIMDDEEFHQQLLRQLKLFIQWKDEDIEKLLPAVKFQYTDWFNRDDALANTRMFIQLSGDLDFHVGDVKTARLHSRQSSAPISGNTYFYRFDRKPSWVKGYPWNKGATHGEELYFLFGYTFGFNGTDEDHALSREVMEYWTNFAITGDPNSPNRNFVKVKWPTFNTETEEYLKINVNMSSDSISKCPYDRRDAFWEDFFPSQLKLVDDFNQKKKKNEHENCKEKRKAASVGSRVFRMLHLSMIVVVVYFLTYL